MKETEMVDKILEDLKEKTRKAEEEEKNIKTWVVNDKSTALDHFAYNLSLTLLNTQRAHKIIHLSAAISILIFKNYEIGDPSFAKELIDACKDLETWMDKWRNHLNDLCDKYAKVKTPSPSK